MKIEKLGYRSWSFDNGRFNDVLEITTNEQNDGFVDVILKCDNKEVSLKVKEQYYKPFYEVEQLFTQIKLKALDVSKFKENPNVDLVRSLGIVCQELGFNICIQTHGDEEEDFVAYKEPVCFADGDMIKRLSVGINHHEYTLEKYLDLKKIEVKQVIYDNNWNHLETNIKVVKVGHKETLGPISGIRAVDLFN